MHFDKKIVRDKKKFLGKKRNGNRWSHITTEKHSEIRRNSERKRCIESRFSLQFIHILCIHLSQPCSIETIFELNWCVCHAKCFTIFVFISIILSIALSPLQLSSNFFHFFCWCSMKKFCSSLSSFRVICLQLHKICKFSSISGDKKNIVYSWKKDGKKVTQTQYSLFALPFSMTTNWKVADYVFLSAYIGSLCTFNECVCDYDYKTITYLSHHLSSGNTWIWCWAQRHNFPHQNAKTPNIWLDGE